MEELLGGLKAAAEPTRLRLLALCAHGELSAGELTHILAQSQPRVSRHLKLLCDAGLLERFREGTNAFYHLATEGAPGRLAQMLVAAVPDGDAIADLDLERLAGIKRDRAQAAAKYFQAVAPKWDEVRSLYVDEREVERILLDIVTKDSGGRLLDIGTGTGRIVELLAPHVERAIGVDLSRRMLAFARTKIESANLSNTSIRQGDMYQLPWPAASFDIVTVHQVLHFADEPGAVIAEAARVLSPGGRLIVVDFTPHDLERLRGEHAHRRLGFADPEIEAWFIRLGLTLEKPIHLKGDPLTLAIWSASCPPARLGLGPVRLAAVAGGPEQSG
ncbi:MAG: ArsR/SmtB family transcription factor [Alphaproteobacteria bacterium]